MQLINLTPHAVHILDHRHDVLLSVEPTLPSARVQVSTQKVGFIEETDIPLVVGNYGVVIDMPDPCPGVMYIVSALVRQALPARQDLVSPAQFVRNAMGHIIGCQALEKNPRP